MIKRLAPWIFSALFAACASKKEANHEKTFMTTQDPHTFAQPDSARMTHLSLDLTVDFKTPGPGGHRYLLRGRPAGQYQCHLRYARPPHCIGRR
ncbi:hypothetical protein [Candidatus Pollutiaquabacter sp.]|uniref:hypothetical protein n=1 Tax=Candidatus Pollutiaquabacter sp. TaxID=3416354 RepID=UPI003D0DD247